MARARPQVMYFDPVQRCEGLATKGRFRVRFSCSPDGRAHYAKTLAGPDVPASEVPFDLRDAVDRHCNNNCRGQRWRFPPGLRGCSRGSRR